MIRKGTENDILKISRLWLKMVDELAPDYTPNVEWWREIAYNTIRNGMYHVFVIEEGGRLLGFLDFFLYPEPSTGKVHMVGQHFWVEPEMRSNCVSGKLYRTALKSAIDILREISEPVLE